VLERLKTLNLAGPIMVSPGTPEKLRKFLEVNPSITGPSFFVDDSANYGAFKNMRFGSLDDEPPKEAVDAMRAPDLGWDGWLTYLGNVVSLSPIRDGEDGVPEGVKLLGGTIVLSGDKVVYASADRLPGDYPAPAAVLREIEALA
jgi:hypothetical protein